MNSFTKNIVGEALKGQPCGELAETALSYLQEYFFSQVNSQVDKQFILPVLAICQAIDSKPAKKETGKPKAA